jgi:hypothetical protein
VSKLNGAQPSDPLDDLDDVIAELEGSEWDDEEITETNITVEKGATVVITGKHQAMSQGQAAAVTKPDNEKPSDPPPSKVSPLAVAWLGVKRMPPWGITAVFLAVVAAYVILNR